MAMRPEGDEDAAGGDALVSAALLVEVHRLQVVPRLGRHAPLISLKSCTNFTKRTALFYLVNRIGPGNTADSNLQISSGQPLFDIPGPFWKGRSLAVSRIASSGPSTSSPRTRPTAEAKSCSSY